MVRCFFTVSISEKTLYSILFVNADKVIQLQAWSAHKDENLNNISLSVDMDRHII